MRIRAIKVKTRYWRPGTDYASEIVSAVGSILEDGDVVTISEKAISTASGLIIDESSINAGSLAKFLTTFWTRRIWGGPLGYLSRLREITRRRLRDFPVDAGAKHKQTALMLVGFLQSLRHYSEGGIDASNLPYSYVSLPLTNPQAAAARIRTAVEKDVGKKVCVMIVDGDTTYSWRNLHLAPRRVGIFGFVFLGGFATFVVGRILGLKARSTPIAISGDGFNPDWALTLANVAHRVRGHGAGRTVWDMSEAFGAGITEVTWEMLEAIEHAPIVVIRRLTSLKVEE